MSESTDIRVDLVEAARTFLVDGRGLTAIVSAVGDSEILLRPTRFVVPVVLERAIFLETKGQRCVCLEFTVTSTSNRQRQANGSRCQVR